MEIGSQQVHYPYQHVKFHAVVRNDEVVKLVPGEHVSGRFAFSNQRESWIVFTQVFFTSYDEAALEVSEHIVDGGASTFGVTVAYC